jgi:hypothetical protein
MQFIYDDGGRGAAGFKGSAGDCVARAIAIATGRPYAEVYRFLAEGNGGERRAKRGRARGRTARSGIHTTRKWFKDYMAAMGWTWTPTMGIGTGCMVHMNDCELPSGRLIVKLSRHYSAVIDGVCHDTFDPCRGGDRCVYGYWSATS